MWDSIVWRGRVNLSVHCTLQNSKILHSQPWLFWSMHHNRLHTVCVTGKSPVCSAQIYSQMKITLGYFASSRLLRPMLCTFFMHFFFKSSKMMRCGWNDVIFFLLPPLNLSVTDFFFFNPAAGDNICMHTVAASTYSNKLGSSPSIAILPWTAGAGTPCNTTHAHVRPTSTNKRRH